MPTNAFRLALALCAAGLAWPGSVSALTCTSADQDRLNRMYKAYVDSGREPVPALENYQMIGSGVSVTGTVTGITRFESCWKESPPCAREPEYARAQISFLTSTAEVRNVFAGDARHALMECFRRLGLAVPERESGFINRLFR